MIERMKERLLCFVEQDKDNISKMLEVIEKVHKALLALFDVEAKLAELFVINSSNSGKQTLTDTRISLLEEIREELIDEKNMNVLLSEEFESMLPENDIYQYGIEKTCCVCDSLSRFFEVAAQRLTNSSNQIIKKAKNIFDDCRGGISESIKSEFLLCVDDYAVSSSDLKNLCDEMSLDFRGLRDELRELHSLSDVHMDAELSDSFEDFLEEELQEEIIMEGCLSIDPEIQARYSISTVPCACYENPKRNENDKSDSKNNSKRSFLGLFKRKNKTYLSSEEEFVTPLSIDSVQFSAVAPNRVVPGKYLPINIVMYEDAFRKIVDEIISSHKKGAKESRSGYQCVEHNSSIKVILTSPDVTIEDGEEERKWFGKYLNFEFAAKIPNDFAEEQILFFAKIYINGIIASKLKLILDCERKSKRNLTVTREDILSAFVSYASQDRNRVAAIIQGMKKVRPDMDIFFDIESLRSGEYWEETLKNEISNRDILFLCWSKFARDSKWVDMEWRYALENKGEDCIEPIPIDSPDVCPPPVELEQKHFNDRMLYIIKATIQTECGQPCLIRSKTGEFMIINKSVVCIGKQRECVDLFIGDNDAISRNHANIVEREGKYYIVDTNSTNHTYVDGEQIPSNVETIIHFGAKIRLADEEFEFVCI